MTTIVATTLLSWVKTEVDYALKTVRDNIARFTAAPDDLAVLSGCPDQLHQIKGTLHILGLNGATRFCDTIENAFEGASKGQRLSNSKLAVIDRAVLALKEFIDGLSKGETNLPIKLFPIYQELSTLQGNPGVSEKDLFYPDLKPAAPLHPACRTVPDKELAAFLQTQRSRFQRGLLSWLRNPSDAPGLQDMRQALDAMDQIASQLPEPRALWWTAFGFVDGLSHSPAPERVAAAKPICSKIDLQMRDLAKGSKAPNELLLREMLYALATSKADTQRIKDVKQLYQLDTLFPEPDMLGLMEFDMDWLEPTLHDIHARLDAIKNTWVQYISGESGALLKFREVVKALKSKIDELGNHQLVRLLDVIIMVATRLPDPYPRQQQLMITEMASAFLLIENIIDNFTNAPSDLEHQVGIMAGWLLDAAKGKSTGQPPAGLRAELSQQISEMQLQAQVAREIQSNLQKVEQVLDAFARDATKRDGLLTLRPHLKQISGALIMLRFSRAAELLTICEEMITACAQPDHAATAQDMDWIAEGLSSLGFFLDPCLRGRPPTAPALELFFKRFDKRTAIPPQASPESALGPVEVSAAVGHAVEPVAAEPEVMERAPSPQSISGITTLDNEELLGIFLEEADEVLANINTALPSSRSQPDNHEALVTIRRGFHTLKGSGRMVGLTDLGETAWEIEQVMNHWLEQHYPATPDLLEFISLASTSFSSWVDQLKSRIEPKIDAQHIIATAQRLKSALVPDVPADMGTDTKAAGADMQSLVAAAPAAPEPEIVIGTVRLARPFYDIYLKEAHQHQAALEEEFKAWRVHPGTAASSKFLRAAHTLSGISRTAGFVSLADLAAGLERCLPLAHNVVAESDIQIIAAAITGLQKMLSDISQFQPAAESGAATAMLHELITRLLAPHAEPSAPTPAMVPPVAESPAPPPYRTTPTDANIIARAAVAAPRQTEQRAIRDDLDPQLLPIFLEEAQELVPLIGSDLRDWKAKPDDMLIQQSLQRTLHTLKGSARMAGAMRLGELAHLMESRMEGALDSGSSSAARLIEELESQMDRLSEGIEHLSRCGAEIQPHTQPEATPDAKLAPAVPGVAQPGIEPPLAGAAAMLRINADVLDRLINEAGEVGIARSRIEGELRTLKQSLFDLNDSIARLRGQLREMELQADSQMQSRQSVLDSDKHDFDPLEFDRYTRLQELTRMMAESLHDVTTIQQTLLKNLGEVDAAVLQQARINRDLQQELMRTRTVPFSNLNERLYRVVRQTARDLNKKANLEIRDSHVELDRSVLEKISAPLEHLLRNAIAHGLESPDARRAANKSEIGEINLTLRQESNEIVIIMSDDGAGLDLEKLRRKGLEKSLLEAGRDPSEAELIQLIFTPGFSTAEEITELSGRGVGMDVVRSEIRGIGGRIETATIHGKGTTFSIYLPLTLAVTQAVLVRSGESTFAISSAMVEQVLRIKPEVLSGFYKCGTIDSQGHTYPLHYLRHLVGSDHAAAQIQSYNSVLLLRSGIQRAALHVDELIGNQEIIVKNVNPQLARVPGIAGATVLGDGKIVLILNPVQLARHGRTVATTAILQPVMSKPLARVVMVVDDSLTVRKITSRLLEHEGYHVLTAKDGVDALEQLKETLPDVMLVDIEMPRMDGFDLTRNIRHEPRTAAIPIIIISSRTAEKHRSHAEQLGVNAFLGKPYHEADLLKLVAQYLDEMQDRTVIH